ncbi:MAG: O-antigen ligase family protein, partial [Bacteroidia bacterium]|nr:O-antigen ligase family protein [Bacteroidia bacterium]
MLIYFIVRVLVNSRTRFDTIVKILFWITVANGFYAVMQQLTGIVILEKSFREEVQVGNNLLKEVMYSLRSTGFFGSPFTFGIVSVIGFLCGFYLHIEKDRIRFNRFILFGGIVINMIAILLSSSRSSYLAVLISPLILLVISPKHLFKLFIQHIRYIFLIILVTAGIVTLFRSNKAVNFSMSRVGTVKQLASKVKGDSVQNYHKNFQLREDLLTFSIEYVSANPFGYGLGIFTGTANSKAEVAVGGRSRWVDNEFSALALEMG